jgi:hypothetical protein
LIYLNSNEVTTLDGIDRSANQHPADITHISGETAANEVVLNNQLDQLVAAMVAYDVPAGIGNVIPQDVSDDLQPVLAENWQVIS